MFKKIIVTLSFLLAISALYLVMPLPRTTSIDLNSLTVREAPIAFALDHTGKEQKCADGTLYVEPNQIGYADSEVVDSRCARLQTQLIEAAIDGDLIQMRAAFQKGASATSSALAKHSSDPQLPILAGARSRQTEAIRLLLDNGADVDTRYMCCMDSKSLLMLAVAFNDEPTLKLLLERGADLNFRDHFERRDVFDTAEETKNPILVGMLNEVCERAVYSRITCRTRVLRNLFR